MAVRLGLKGYVRNTSGGKVEAVFEGEQVDVEKMIEFCRKGPTGAHVDDIHIDREKWKGEFSGFEVRY